MTMRLFALKTPGDHIIRKQPFSTPLHDQGRSLKTSYNQSWRQISRVIPLPSPRHQAMHFSAQSKVKSFPMNKALLACGFWPEAEDRALRGRNLSAAIRSLYREGEAFLKSFFPLSSLLPHTPLSGRELNAINPPSNVLSASALLTGAPEKFFPHPEPNHILIGEFDCPFFRGKYMRLRAADVRLRAADVRSRA